MHWWSFNIFIDEICPYDLYKDLRVTNPAPFAAFLNFVSTPSSITSVCCSSPERFLKLEQERLESKPIKGNFYFSFQDWRANSNVSFESVSCLIFWVRNYWTVIQSFNRWPIKASITRKCKGMKMWYWFLSCIGKLICKLCIRIEQKT